MNKLVTAAVMALFLTACGGGGGSDGGSSTNSGSTAGTGSVGLLLTDGPTDDFDEVNITIVKAELLSDSGRVTIFQGNETVNLLDYRNDSRIFSLDPSVPAGTYEKIRLTLSKIELVKCEDGAVIQPVDVDTCVNTIPDDDQPRLTGNKKLDLNPRGDFMVHSGNVLMVEIDIDANKSIHIVETGNGKYQFRPVVFIKIITKDNPGKNVRVHGIIEDLDPADREFEICSREINLLPGIDDLDKDTACVDVTYNDGTSIFKDGVSVGPGALRDGDEATVFGHLRLDDEDSDEVEHHVAGGEDDHHDFDGVFIDALVIEIGPDDIDDNLDGVALTAVDDRFLFDMSIDPGQGFTEGSEVTVLIQPDTKIIQQNGRIIPVTYIQPGVPLSVDGELQLSDTNPAVLLAELIVVDTEAGVRDRLSGIIGLIPDKVCGLNLRTNSGDRSVSANNKDTLVLRVTETDAVGVSDVLLVEDLESGDAVDVYGQDDGLGCFAAEIIVVLGELLPEPK